MVAKADGYFGHPFKGHRSVTQGNPLPPTVFNMVVDDIICHWVTVMTQTEAGTGGLGLTIIDMAAYFYANGGLVVLTQPERLQRAFDVITCLFDRVGLRKNT